LYANPATQQPSNPATQQPSNPATQQPSNNMHLSFFYMALTVTSTPIKISPSIRTDWPTNIFMTGAAEYFGMYLPLDNEGHDLSTIQCLTDPGYALGLCSSPTINQIGNGSGQSCTFIGIDGWMATVEDGKIIDVGPPQRIVHGKCEA
jgi:hypothetical protein